MVKKIGVVLLAVLILFNMSIFAIGETNADAVTEADNKIKVACVGDGITYGDTIKNIGSDSYPALLQKELGEEFIVENFGASETTVLKSTKSPYVNTKEYKASLEFKPDSLCIMFGTNDIMDENWLNGKNNFKKDYKAVIDSYKAVNPDVEVYVMVPPAILKSDVNGERNPVILENEAIPQIKELAEEIGATEINIFDAFDGYSELLSDFLHPNEQGTAVMAKTIGQRIIDDNKIKVACIGDSITRGVGIKDISKDSYPAVLQKILGNDFVVKNYGVSGCSALKSAVWPYIENLEYKQSLEFKPDVICIMFGTNDIKDENWLEGKDNFKTDYKAIIDSYKAKNPELKVYMMIPPAILKVNVSGVRNPVILENEGIPKIKELADEIGATKIDLFELFDGYGELFPDFLHPNEDGASMIAKEIGQTFSKDFPNVANASNIIGTSYWAIEEIILGYDEGLVPDGLIGKYQEAIDRETFCEMVVRMFNDAEEAAKAPFVDVNNASIDKAYALGIVNGISETEFNPHANITREEICAMLARAFKKIADADDSVAGDKTFPDSDKISAWAIDDVKFMNSINIIKGDTDGSIRPLDNTTNEEAILLVYRTFIAAGSYGEATK